MRQALRLLLFIGVLLPIVSYGQTINMTGGNQTVTGTPSTNGAATGTPNSSVTFTCTGAQNTDTVTISAYTGSITNGIVNATSYGTGSASITTSTLPVGANTVQCKDSSTFLGYFYTVSADPTRSSVSIVDIQGPDETPLNGTVCFTPVNYLSQPTPFNANGVAAIRPVAACRPVVNGGVSTILLLPRSNLTIPTGVQYQVSLIDSTTNQKQIYGSFEVTGDTWSLDSAAPSNVQTAPPAAWVPTITIGTVTALAAGSTPTVTDSGSQLGHIFNFGLPQGIQGPQGPVGPVGPQGLPGAATVAIGSVTTGAAGSNASVTNVGTQNAAILNFTVPQGPAGTATAAGTIGQTQVAGSGGQLQATNIVVDSTGNGESVPGLLLAANTNTPSAALAKFRTAVVDANVNPVSVVTIGDSITHGTGPTNLANSYVQQMAAWLSHYGYGGSVSYPVNGTSGATPGARLNFNWALSGGWTSGQDLGPYQNTGNTGQGFQSIYISSTTTDSLTYSGQTGSQLDVFTEETTDSAGCSVTVDGTLLGTAGGATASVPTATRTRFTGLTGSAHTLVINPTASGKCYFYGAAFSNPTGVVVYDPAIGGAQSNAFGSNTATQLAFLKTISPAPALFTIALGVNDAGFNDGVTQAQYAINMTNIVNYLQTNFPDANILILDNYATGTPGGSVITQAQVRQSEQLLAQTDNLAYFSFNDVFGPEPDAYARGLLNSDLTHPTDAGALEMGYEVNKVLIAQPPPVGLGTQALGIPLSVASLHQNASTISAPLLTSNGLYPGLGWFHNNSSDSSNPNNNDAGTSFGNFGGSYGIYDYLPQNWTRNFCSFYPGGSGNTPITSLSQLTCLTITPPTSSTGNISVTFPNSGRVFVAPTSQTSAEQNFTLVPSAPITGTAINAGLNTASGGNTIGYASGIAYGVFGSSNYGSYFFRPDNFTDWQDCTYAHGTALTSTSQLTCQILAHFPTSVTSAEQNLTLVPNAPATGTAINPSLNLSAATAAGYATGIGYAVIGGNTVDYLYRPSSFPAPKSCTYPAGTALSSTSQLTCNTITTLNTSGQIPLAQLGTGTPTAGMYVDGGTGAWTTLPTSPSTGTASIGTFATGGSGSVTSGSNNGSGVISFTASASIGPSVDLAVVTFSVANTANTCQLNPMNDATAALGTNVYAASLSTTGFHLHVGLVALSAGSYQFGYICK